MVAEEWGGGCRERMEEVSEGEGEGVGEWKVMREGGLWRDDRRG